MKKRVTIGLVLLFIFLVIVAVWYSFNKPHRNVLNETAMAVTADSLYAAYSTNEKEANTRFLDKALIVTGTVDELITNQQGQRVIVLRTADPIGAVTATLSSPPAGDLQPGTDVKVMGFCSGYSTDVVLRDCLLVPEQGKK